MLDPINYRYSSRCMGDRYDWPADCGHPDCGVLCDPAIRADRAEAGHYTDPTIYSVDPKVVTPAAVYERLRAGLTIAQTAAWFNVPRWVVCAKISRTPPDRILDAEVLLLQDQLPIKRTAALLGMHESNLRDLCRRCGWETTKQWTLSDEAKAARSVRS